MAYKLFHPCKIFPELYDPCAYFPLFGQFHFASLISVSMHSIFSLLQNRIYIFVCVYGFFFAKLHYIFFKEGDKVFPLLYHPHYLAKVWTCVEWRLINVYWLFYSQAAKANILLLLFFPFSTSVLCYREA